MRCLLILVLFCLGIALAVPVVTKDSRQKGLEQSSEEVKGDERMGRRKRCYCAMDYLPNGYYGYNSGYGNYGYSSGYSNYGYNYPYNSYGYNSYPSYNSFSYGYNPYYSG